MMNIPTVLFRHFTPVARSFSRSFSWMFLCLGVVWGAYASPALAIETIASHAYLIDSKTGAVLFDKNGTERMAPASMSKLMTVHMVFERLRDGRLSLDDTFPVSERAWRLGGAKSGSSTMFLDPGSRVRVEDLLRGIIVQSGNDACIVLAEGLDGSEDAFAEEMTRRAHEIGLNDSTFKNATGWPDPDHLMSSRDLALLAKSTIEDFPEYYHYYGEREFTYNGIRQTNRNPLLYKGMNVDGLKTGHTEDSGYGLVASAERHGRRLILVMNGLPSKKMRSREPERFLEWGFREFENYKLFSAGEVVVEPTVWLGVDATVPLLIKDELLLTLPRKSRRDMKVEIVYNAPIPAPIAEGQTLAHVNIIVPGQDTLEIPLVAGKSVDRLGFFGRLSATLNHILWGRSQ